MQYSYADSPFYLRFPVAVRGFLIAAMIVVTDALINILLAYPSDPGSPIRPGCDCNFEYGRSTEGQLSRMADRTQTAPIALSGWYDPPEGQDYPQDLRTLALTGIDPPVLTGIDPISSSMIQYNDFIVRASFLDHSACFVSFAAPTLNVFCENALLTSDGIRSTSQTGQTVSARYRMRFQIRGPTAGIPSPRPSRERRGSSEGLGAQTRIVRESGRIGSENIGTGRLTRQR
jgi:hypothetical protein